MPSGPSSWVLVQKLRSFQEGFAIPGRSAWAVPSLRASFRYASFSYISGYALRALLVVSSYFPLTNLDKLETSKSRKAPSGPSNLATLHR